MKSLVLLICFITINPIFSMEAPLHPISPAEEIGVPEEPYVKFTSLLFAFTRRQIAKLDDVGTMGYFHINEPILYKQKLEDIKYQLKEALFWMHEYHEVSGIVKFPVKDGITTGYHRLPLTQIQEDAKQAMIFFYEHYHNKDLAQYNEAGKVFLLNQRNKFKQIFNLYEK